MISRPQFESKIGEFLASVGSVRWLEQAGAPWNGPVVPDVATAWDDWNQAMLDAWIPNSKDLEARAVEQLGDEAIDLVFQQVATELRAPVGAAVGRYFDRRPEDLNENTLCGADHGLYPELIDAILRDCAWAAIEYALSRPAFFTALLDCYRAGRWPCAWQGRYPAGEVVVL